MKSFPRGGKKPEVKKSSNVLSDWKPNKPNKKHKTKVRNDVTEETNLVNAADRLSYLTICEGMVFLGRVSKATEYELIVSIPGGLIGRVQVTDLSESYMYLLQSLINSKNTQSSELKSLPDLYAPGDYVVCYVKSVNPDGKWLYTLSLEPQLINKNIDSSYLVKGMKIVCTIKSIEEHGYVIDTGIANVTAFIATKDVGKKKQYFPGNQIFCMVKDIKTENHVSVVVLSAKRKIIDSVSIHDVVSLDVLTPGTKFPLYVTKILSNGLQVRFGKNNVGCINQVYLDSPLSAYANNMELTGTLLYIMPVVKLAYFSLLTSDDASEKEKLSVGSDIEKAKVMYRESNGIVFKISKSGLRGFVSLRRSDIPFAKISIIFKPGSTHKCRILSYNWMEHLYICTMEDKLLKQKYFSPSDLNFGDILTVKVASIDTRTGFVRVLAGKIYGTVVPEHVSDGGLSALSKLTIGDDVEARVLDIDNDKRNVRFTLKQSLIKSELPILHDVQEARCGAVHHGTVTKINKNGLLVRFYGSAKGWVPCIVLDKDTADMNWNYSVGQTVTVSIDSVQKEGNMKLRIVFTGERKHQQQSVSMPIGKLVEGTVVESSFDGIQLRIRKASGDDGDDATTVTGFLPAGHMAPCAEIGGLLASKCSPGDVITAFVFATQPSVILSRTYMTQQRYRRFDTLKVGDCIPCTIRDIVPDGVRVVLPIEDYSAFGFVSYKHVSNYEMLRVNQILFVKITAVGTRQRQLSLTMALKDVWESSSRDVPGARVTSAVDVLSLYLNKLLELSTNTFYRNRPISSATLGQKVTGHVEKITDHCLVLRLENNLMGTVRKDHYTGNPKIGDKVLGTVLWKNYVHEFVDVSLLPRIVNGVSSKQQTLPQLPDALVLRGEILIITSWLILVLIKRNGTGYLAALPARRHLNDIAPDLTPYSIHDKIRLYVVMNRSESDIVPICVLKSAFEVSKSDAAIAQSASKTVNKKSKRKASAREDEDPADAKMPRIERDNEKTSNDVGVNEKKRPDNRASKVSVKKEEAKSGCDGKRKGHEEKRKALVVAEENKIKDIDENSERNSSSDESETEDHLPTSAEERSHVPECGFHWDDKSNSAIVTNIETSSDEGEEVEVMEEEEGSKRKKRLSAAERREQERQKEREIRQREEALASDQLPNSIDQFDRLVLSSPDSSLVWLQYMAYHLQATEIDKARSVAQRAIKTINFREENERLNVWNAWLNLESRFGSPESLNDVFQEAVRVNDASKVYTHMLSVHVDAGRQVELEKLISVMIVKFKQDPQTWVDCGTTLLKVGLKERSRRIMQRALQSLPASQHVNLIVRFANLENKLGDKERSQTLFEEILISYPKRVDVWSSYVDCLVKSGDIDMARRVLERAVVQTLPVRKMKTLFKKFMSFEEKYGTPEAVVQVQRMAADYVEKQCNRESV